MKIGVINSPVRNLLEEIKWIGENGFDFIDLEPYEPYSIDIKKVKEALTYYKLEAIGHTNPFLPFIFPNKDIRKACLKEFKKCIHIFKELDIKLMNIHPSYNGKPYSNEDKIRENIEFLKEVNTMCKSEGITLMIENYIAPFGSPRSFKRILREVPELKMHLDVGHSNIGFDKNIAESFFKTFGNEIIHLHFSDNKGKKDDHLPLGCGNIDWKEIVRVIKKAGYDSTITLEIFSPDRDYLLLSRDKLKKWLKEEENAILQ